MKKTCRCILALMLMVLVMLPISAYAAGSIDPARDVELTLLYQDKDTPLAGAKFSVYQVATVDESGELTVTETFKDFNVDIQGKDDAAWKELASTLEGYILRDGIQAADSGTTDQAGTLAFPTQGKKLAQGLYLVLGQRHTQDGYYYDTSPFMVMLPSQDTEANEWVYEVSVTPKQDASKIPDEPTTITRKVLKVWNDAGSEGARPQEVVVDLLKDGKVYDTVTLNAQNNWRHTWSELDESSTWTVAERELSNYKVTVTQEGTTFVVTNTYSSDVPVTPDEPTPDKKLPQTGVLWWPVPVLACAGLAFLVIGALGAKKKKRDGME